MHPCRRESTFANVPCRRLVRYASLQEAGKICIPAGEMQDMHPCKRETETEDSTGQSHTGQGGKRATLQGSTTLYNPFKTKV